MGKIGLIIRREYLVRLRKRSFLVMTLLGPLLFAALIIVPAWISQKQDQQVKTIAVIDSSGLFIGALPETKFIRFEYLHNKTVEQVRHNWSHNDYYALLYIGHIVTYTPDAVQLMSYRQPALPVLMHISHSIEKMLESMKLSTYGVPGIEGMLKAAKTGVTVRPIKWSRYDGSDDQTSVFGVATVLAYLGGFLIYFFVFMFGAQVLRGVSEEKNNRIVEIIVSVVQPVQLMFGKIAGIGLLGLTQFLVWILLSLVLLGLGKSFFRTDSAHLSSAQPTDLFSVSSTLAAEQVPLSEHTILYSDILSNLSAINFPLMLTSFLFFFIAGYLLYGSIFAALGALSDSETDAQQFMLPVTIPLVIAVLMLFPVIQDPDGNAAFWLSVIPYTSPVIMMARIPFGIPYGELLLSVCSLIVFVILHIYLSARIYRTCILFYGKKVKLKDITRWILHH